MKLQELNEKHAVVKIGGHTLVLNENRHSNGSIEISYSTFAGFKDWYSNQTVITSKGYERLGHAWLDWPDRRQFTKVDFNPRGTPPDVYNLYRGFSVEPVEGDCSLYLNHIKDVIASGDEILFKWLLDFMADGVQNLATKPGVAMVMRGEQGVGKGIFAQYYGKLFEPHYAQIANPKYLFGGFNALLEDTTLIYADEAFFAGNREHEGILKALITEDTINIERKGKDVVCRKNFVRLIIASNNDWVVPAMGSERRFCVIDVSGAKRGDHAYFQAIADQMDNVVWKR